MNEKRDPICESIIRELPALLPRLSNAALLKINEIVLEDLREREKTTGKGD
jgi:hypothetical protein